MTAAELAPIPGGQLSNEAARAWNAGPAKAGCRPLGPNSSYRDFAGQVFFWNKFVAGTGNLAARPGTSNHGWGKAIDLAAPHMRTWINQHGARYGWRKVEAPGEWWHVNYVGGFKPKPSPLRSLTRKQRSAAERLLYHRQQTIREARSGRGPRYRRHQKWRGHWRKQVERQRGKASGAQKLALTKVLKNRDGRL